MEDKHFVVLNGTLKFDGDCENTRPFCGAVCCKNTVVLLTEEEQLTGDYDAVEPTKDCNCVTCNAMRDAGRMALRRNENGCIYLDGVSKCSIYDRRPNMCRQYDCSATWWKLSSISRSQDSSGPVGTRYVAN